VNRSLVSIVAFLAGLVPVLYFIAGGRWLMAAMCVAIIFALMLFRRMDLWWVVAVGAAGSNLQLGTHHAALSLLAMLGFCALGIAHFIMTQGRSRQSVSPVPKKAAQLLLVVVILTAFMRGWGLRVLGSSNWGGMDYIILISAILFYIFSFTISLDRKRLSRVVRWLCLLSLIPAATVVLIRVASPFSWLQLVVRVSGGELAGELGLTEARWGEMQMPAVWIGLLALMTYDRKMNLTPSVPVLALLSFTMMGLSGHRTVTVWLGLTLMVYLLIQRRFITSGHILGLLGILSVALISVYLFAGYLPVTFQRALAWLPGIQVAHEAAMSAVGTTTWRIELWRKMLPMVPEYLLVGRGLGFDLREAYAAYTLASDFDHHQFFIATHNYHNGPLFLLIDLGLMGFLAATAFMFGGSAYYRRALSEMPRNSEWRSVYTVFLAFFVGSSIFFFMVIGYVAALAQLLMVGSILQVVLQSVRVEQTSLAEGSEPVRASIRNRGRFVGDWKAPQPIGGYGARPAWNRMRI
jgi:hypothetical protein